MLNYEINLVKVNTLHIIRLKYGGEELSFQKFVITILDAKATIINAFACSRSQSGIHLYVFTKESYHIRHPAKLQIFDIYGEKLE